MRDGREGVPSGCMFSVHMSLMCACAQHVQGLSDFCSVCLFIYTSNSFCRFKDMYKDT